MRFVTLSIVAIITMLSGCATAPATPQEQSRCGQQPTEAEIADSVQVYIKNIGWKDPDSVHVQNIRMKGCSSSWNGLINGGGHTIGWEIDFEVNAKNSYGGYTGFEPKSIMRTSDGIVHWSLE
jgi:hypothetical protein